MTEKGHEERFAAPSLSVGFSIAAYVKPRPDQLKPAHWVDDRRVVSGILHMLRCAARWRDCPPEYGPYTTIYNRFNRWSRQGIWLAMFEAVTGQAAVIGTAAIDSSHMKAHRSAAGGKDPMRVEGGLTW